MAREKLGGVRLKLSSNEDINNEEVKELIEFNQVKDIVKVHEIQAPQSSAFQLEKVY